MSWKYIILVRKVDIKNIFIFIWEERKRFLLFLDGEVETRIHPVVKARQARKLNAVVFWETIRF